MSQPSSSTSRGSRSERCQPSSLFNGGLLAACGLRSTSSSTRERIPKGPDPIGTRTSSALAPFPRPPPDRALSQEVVPKSQPRIEALGRGRDPLSSSRGKLRRIPAGSSTSASSSSLLPASSQSSADVRPCSRQVLVSETGEQAEGRGSGESNDRGGAIPAGAAAPPPVPGGMPDHGSVEKIVFCPQSLVQPLRLLCGKILAELVTHLDNQDVRRSKVSARALMAIPYILITL